MLGWEEILHGDKVSREAAHLCLDQLPGRADAAAAGYPVVMAPAQHLYLDLAWNQDIPRTRALLGGPLNLEQVHACDPAQPISMPTITSWGAGPCGRNDHLSRSSRLHVVPAPAGTAGWPGRPRRKAWDHFAARLPGQLQILDQLRGALPGATEVVLSFSFRRPPGRRFYS